MLTLGFDVIVMVCLGLASMLVVTISMAVAGTTDEECSAAIASSFFTVMVMLAGYCVMSKLLDMMVVV